MNRALSARTLAVAVGAPSVGRESILQGSSNDAQVPYRPPTAALTTSLNCSSVNIYPARTGLGPWDPALTADAPEPEYL